MDSISSSGGGISTPVRGSAGFHTSDVVSSPQSTAVAEFVAQIPDLMFMRSGVVCLPRLGEGARRESAVSDAFDGFGGEGGLF